MGPPAVVHARAAKLFITGWNISFEFTHLVEYLDPISPPVAYIHQGVISDGHTMRDLHEIAARARALFGFCTLENPLAQEVPIVVEHRHAMITSRFFTVGNVNVGIGSVDADPSGRKNPMWLEFKAILYLVKMPDLMSHH